MARAQKSPSRAIFKLKQIDSMAATFFHHQNQKQQTKTKTKQTNHQQSTTLLRRGIIHPSRTILDLGASPGGWSKYAAETMRSDGTLIAVDLLPLDERTVQSITDNPNAPTFHTIQGDFTTKMVQDEIIHLFSSRSSSSTNETTTNGTCSDGGVSLIISDMAPSFTGDRMADTLHTLNLCEETLMLAIGPRCFDEHYVAGEEEETNNNNDDGGLLQRGGSFLCKYFACGQENEYDLMSSIKRNFAYWTILKPKASRKESSELYLFATGYKCRYKGGL